MKIRWGYVFGAFWMVAASSAVSTAPKAVPRPSAIGTAERIARPQSAAVRAQSAAALGGEQLEPPSKAFVDKYCTTCHNQRTKTAGLMLDTMDVANVGTHAPEWEKVVVKLRAGLMPPSGMPRPEPPVIDAFASSLEAALDRNAAAHPNPGRTEPFHRLNRADNQNAVRDMLSLDLDVSNLLPHDEVSYGFDNIAGVLKLSPLLTESYLNAAQKVSRLALGRPGPQDGLDRAFPTSSIRTCASKGCRWARAAARRSTTSRREPVST